jgi:hypothetical protein
MKKNYKKQEMDIVFATPCHLMAPSKISGGKAGDGNDDDYGGFGGEGTGEDDMNARQHNNWMWDNLEEE